MKKNNLNKKELNSNKNVKNDLIGLMINYLIGNKQEIKNKKNKKYNFDFSLLIMLFMESYESTHFKKFLECSSLKIQKNLWRYSKY